jgi:DNA (cytosine-5)-methyltransferase 1
MKHLDLFSGIGGFSLAADRVWDSVDHTFVEYEPFCQAILRKHWPEAEIHGDIHEFIVNANSQRKRNGLAAIQKAHGKVPQRDDDAQPSHADTYLLTGGFPCQPFSVAGRRKGTNDDRYLWPAMFSAVSLFRPRWVIAENVAGLASWNEGLVLETVCADLESEGYEVQPFVIPAAAVGAPHRRDRVWIVANAKHESERDTERRRNDERTPTGATGSDTDAPDSHDTRLERRKRESLQGRRKGHTEHSGGNWTENWSEVAARLCRVDDGLPRRMDRTPRLKALGNAIVPQVAEEIMRAIKHEEEKALTTH